MRKSTRRAFRELWKLDSNKFDFIGESRVIDFMSVLGNESSGFDPKYVVEYCNFQVCHMEALMLVLKDQRKEKLELSFH